MKWQFNLFPIILVFYFSGQLYSQQLILQPDPNAGHDAFLFELEPNTNFGDYTDFIAFYWTFFGVEGKGSSLLKFDLSTLPQQIKITNATLSLSHNEYSTNQGQAGNNACYLEKIVEPWNEHTVTWNSNPNSSFMHRKYLPASHSENQNYSDIDITNFVQEWYHSPLTNHGFKIELVESSLYSSMKFCSSDHHIAAKRPKLIINYKSELDSCRSFRPSPDEGIDAFLFELEPTTNFSNYPDLIAFSWTFFGVPGYGNSLIKFDLTTLPDDIEITSAGLSLFHNASSTNQGQAGNNACYLRKVIEDWDPATVTWNSSPTVTGNNQVYLPTSQVSDQNYKNISVIDFVKEWHARPDKNYGMMLTLEDKSLYNSMKFCSSEHPIEAYRPELIVCYQKIISKTTENNSSWNISIQPTQSQNEWIIHTSKLTNGLQIQLYNEMGTPVSIRSTVFDLQVKLDASSLPTGMYFLNLIQGQHISKHKLIRM
ncbi:MAG: DNRLRE domain-containing protein [Saprospiraceae bacterium]|nr:DNRLRE domain-containing protein [Saprospiraceae bacterium]